MDHYCAMSANDIRWLPRWLSIEALSLRLPVSKWWYRYMIEATGTGMILPLAEGMPAV